MTLQTVFDLYKNVFEIVAFCGCTAKFQKEFNRRYRAIGKTLILETTKESKEALSLSPETKLNKGAEKKYQELRVWLKTQDSFFSEL